MKGSRQLSCEQNTASGWSQRCCRATSVRSTRPTSAKDRNRPRLLNSAALGITDVDSHPHPAQSGTVRVRYEGPLRPWTPRYVDAAADSWELWRVRRAPPQSLPVRSQRSTHAQAAIAHAWWQLKRPAAPRARALAQTPTTPPARSCRWRPESSVARAPRALLRATAAGTTLAAWATRGWPPGCSTASSSG